MHALADLHDTDPICAVGSWHVRAWHHTPACPPGRSERRDARNRHSASDRGTAKLPAATADGTEQAGLELGKRTHSLTRRS